MKRWLHMIVSLLAPVALGHVFDAGNDFRPKSYEPNLEVEEILMPSLLVSIPRFDLNGNLTNDGTRSFHYDAENQLTNITLANAWKRDWIFDGRGRRRIQRDYTWQSGGWALTNETRFIYDGWLPLQERDSNNAVQVTYTRGTDFSGTLGGMGGIGGLLSRTDSNGTTFFHADGAGNITALIDANELVQARYRYDPFGRMIRQSGPLAAVNRMQFSSMPYLGFGLAGFRGRPYDTVLARFISPDPSGEWADANLYRLNYNNPLAYVDPDGMAPQIAGISFDANGRGASLQYVDQQFGQDYGMNLHGPLNPSPPGLILAGLARLQQPVDNAADWLKSSGNPFTRGLGGLLQALQWVLPEGDLGKLGELGKLEKAGAEVGDLVKCKKASEAGSPVFRQGTFADEAAAWEGNYVKGKSWATDNPLTTSDYAKKYGLPSENSGKPDWVVGGEVQGGYTTRPAPPSHNNPANNGGATEVLNPANVQLNWFHMPD